MTRDRRRVGERGSEGGTQEEPEGGVAERGEQQIQRGHHHCWILSHSETRLQWFSPLKLCDQNKRKKDGRIPPPLPRPNPTPTASQLLWATLLWAFWEFQLFDYSLQAGHKPKPSVQVREGGVQVHQNAALPPQDPSADEPVHRHHPEPLQWKRALLQRISTLFQRIPARVGELLWLQR